MARIWPRVQIHILTDLDNICTRSRPKPDTVCTRKHWNQSPGVGKWYTVLRGAAPFCLRGIAPQAAPLPFPVHSDTSLIRKRPPPRTILGPLKYAYRRVLGEGVFSRASYPCKGFGFNFYLGLGLRVWCLDSLRPGYYQVSKRCTISSFRSRCRVEREQLMGLKTFVPKMAQAKARMGSGSGA
jgi:hypothetical protein